MENPQALDSTGGLEGEAMPGMCGAADFWGAGPWEQEAMGGGDFSVHAVNASSAAYHADVAAKHAASLAQWVQYLSVTLGNLQNKVTELEDWKRRALEETRKLREEHRQLRAQVLREEVAASPTRRAGSSDEESPVHPPGLIAGSSTDDKDLTPALKSPGQSPQRMISASSSSTFSIGSASSYQDMDALSKEEGVQVSKVALDGAQCERAVWRIGHLSAKLRGCMGRALVSSPFSAMGLEDVRLMIGPDGKEPAQGKNRRQKELYTKRITEGPLDACLKLKIPNCPEKCELWYYLTVGSARRGPFVHNFAESTVSECGDFGDWLKQLDADKSLTVAVEVFPLAVSGSAGPAGGQQAAAGEKAISDPSEPAMVYPSFRDVGPLQ